MLPPIFLTPDGPDSENMITFPTDESKHALQVLRLKKGEIVICIDGVGNAYKSEINYARNKKVTASVHSLVRNMGEPSCRLTLSIGLSSNSKIDQIIQSGTEVGVSRFVPLLTEKSKIKIEESKKALSKQKRWSRIAISSVKQCRRSVIPDISIPVSLDQYLSEIEKDDIKLIFHPLDVKKSNIGYESISGFFENSNLSSNRISILVGSESGFSEEEVLRAMEVGFVPISLGSRILRTETAGPVISALVLQAVNEFN